MDWIVGQRYTKKRKSSCVNARGIPTVAYQVFHLLPYPGGGGLPTLVGVPTLAGAPTLARGIPTLAGGVPTLAGGYSIPGRGIPQGGYRPGQCRYPPPGVDRLKT